MSTRSSRSVATTSAAATPLPPDWLERFDTNYQRTFYYNKQTKQSQWNRPVLASEDNSLLNTSSLSTQLSQISSTNTPKTRTSSKRLTTPPPLNTSTTTSPSTTATNKRKSLQRVSKFNEWIEVYSEENKRNFYYNTQTKQSVWVDPRTPATTAAPTPKVVATTSIPAVAGMPSSWETVTTTAPKPAATNFSSSSSGEEEEDNHTPAVSTASVVTSPIRPSAAHLPPKQRQASTDYDDDDALGDELRSFTRTLEQERDFISLHTAKLDPKAKAQLYDDDMDNELTRTAEAMASSKPKQGMLKKMMSTSSEMSTASKPATALANWGVEPPKVIEVKRAMKDVESSIKYAQEELKAHKEAASEAKIIDGEGGYYTILGVDTNCDVSTMKKAFRKAMIKAHPDKVAPEERDKAQELAGMLQNAFTCLSDEWERYLYDYLGLRRYLQNAKVIQCFKNYLLSGVQLMKHPRKGYPRRRQFWISPDFQWLMTGKERILEPTAEEMLHIKGVRIADIHDISRGISTEVLERTGKSRKQSRYFSIITNERTLDLEAETKERADFLLSRISLLVLDTQKNKKWLQRFFELKALKDASASFRNGTPTPPPPA